MICEPVERSLLGMTHQWRSYSLSMIFLTGYAVTGCHDGLQAFPLRIEL